MSQFNFLIMGSIGDGKSALIKSLLPDNYIGPMPETKQDGRGVTKTCARYPIKNTFNTCFFIDTPGVGDHDNGLGDTLPMIEDEFAKGIHGVILTCAVGQGRLTLGSKIAAQILKLSIIEKHPEYAKNIIVVGTKADKEDEDDKQIWKERIGPAFGKELGEEPGKIVLTGCKFTAKGRGKDDVGQLTSALEDIKSTHPSLGRMIFHPVNSYKLLSILNKTVGLDLTPEMIEVLSQKIEENRNMGKQEEPRRHDYNQNNGHTENNLKVCCDWILSRLCCCCYTSREGYTQMDSN